ncbi:MAG: hypothetical protein ACOH17_14295 [Cellulomonas sp.]
MTTPDPYAMPWACANPERRRHLVLCPALPPDTATDTDDVGDDVGVGVASDPP